MLIGDTGIDRGEESERLAAAVARTLADAPGAPVLVLGDVFYYVGLVGMCRAHPFSYRGCTAPGSPEDQIETTLAPYRAALPGHPVIALAGNHDHYGGPQGIDNACRLVPRFAPGWRWIAQGCGLDAASPVEVLDLGVVALFLIDSEMMLRDPEWDARTRTALREHLAHFERERPETARVVAAHHPLETHGQHNGAGRVSAVLKDFRLLWSTALLPVSWPLQRLIGAQDPNQGRYRSYRRGLYRLFAELPIDAFVSGHDHSLQHVGIDHPGIRHQIVSGAGTHRSRVKRHGLDLLFTGRLARLAGMRDVVPAPRHRLLFGFGGPQEAPDLTGWGFATLRRVADGLQLEFFDAARAEPLYSALIPRPRAQMRVARSAQ